ncbi:MAG: trypsin-like serine protease, partial [Bdellovibrionota bacterium]|nr:trypsin-like serine protease [Bdellovibrionota bacterium]
MRNPSFFYSKTTSFFLLIFLFFQMTYIQTASGTVREKIGEKFPFVGLIKYENGLVCTGFLIKHGVLATAKHCFSHKDINELNFEPKKLKVSFFKEKEDPFFPQLPLIIKGSDIIQLVLDSGSNDIAYIIYKRESTMNIINLPEIEVNTHRDLSDEAHVFRVGFPMGENHVFDKVLTKDCQFTGKTDF